MRAEPSIASLAIIDGAGEVLAEMATPRAITGDAERVGSASASLAQAATGCPHVDLFEGGEATNWATARHPDTGETRADIPLIDPGPMQRAIVDAALSMMSPGLCSSVGRISGRSPIEGSVFIREAWRPNAPIPVPQVFDPPLVVRFRLD